MPRANTLGIICGALVLAASAGGAAYVGAGKAARSNPLPPRVLVGSDAFGDWSVDAPGTIRRMTRADLPAPYATPSATQPVQSVQRPSGAALHTLPGFEVAQFASGLRNPRLLRVAPNGDVFAAETSAGRIRVLRPAAGGAFVARSEVYAAALSGPFGMAFYPAKDPQWLYVANTNSVVRFAYQDGDLAARGKPETIVASLPEGGHSTRDVVFSADGSTMFVSVGSAGNAGEDLPKLAGAELQRWTDGHVRGAAWGRETRRAAVMAFDPKGGAGRVHATGLRNCVGMAVDEGGQLWCSVNERDGLGDDLVPDFITRVAAAGFYGWPWFYLGGNEDPRHKGARPDLGGGMIPDVLVQAHSAPLQIAVHDGTGMPEGYHGSVFAALHGSWNRSKRTGYKIIRLPVKNGAPTGEYEDFVTGFVIDGARVWGRPVGIAEARDGALLFSDDANGTVWRISYRGPARR